MGSLNFFLRQKVDLTKYIEEHLFNFDYAFGENCSNEQVILKEKMFNLINIFGLVFWKVYMTCVRPIVQAAFQRAKVTCFAYG